MSIAIVFLIIAIIAGIMGFTTLMGAALKIGKVLFFLFLLLFVVAFFFFK